jgi:L-aminopeptidase/D-esterase-like protein
VVVMSGIPVGEPVGWLPAGFRVGHWTSPGAVTGCTVVLPPAGNVCAYDIRGSAPGSRELASLDLARPRTEVHGVLLTGGSVFGLAAADGVCRWLEARGIGFAVRSVAIPIVPAGVIFDAGVLHAAERPDAAAGWAACQTATEGPVRQGRVGAGAGATVGKWAGLESAVPGGLGLAAAGPGRHRVHALAVVNAVGDVLATDGSVLAGTTADRPTWWAAGPTGDAAQPVSTVLGVITAQATMTKPEAQFLAARGSDGITVAVRPAHTRRDGDLVLAVASAGPPLPPDDLDLLGAHAAAAMAAAVRAAVTYPPEP